MTTHIYYHLGKIQRRLQRKSIWRRLFPNRTSIIVAITFIGICLWLGLGAPMP